MTRALRLLRRHGSVIYVTVLVIALSGGSYYLGARNAASAARNAATIGQLCQAGNTARAQQIGLWEHILTIAKPPPRETAAARRQRLAIDRAFVVYLHHVFAPRNCAHPTQTEPAK